MWRHNDVVGQNHTSFALFRLMERENWHIFPHISWVYWLKAFIYQHNNVILLNNNNLLMFYNSRFSVVESIFFVAHSFCYGDFFVTFTVCDHFTNFHRLKYYLLLECFINEESYTETYSIRFGYSFYLYRLGKHSTKRFCKFMSNNFIFWVSFLEKSINIQFANPKKDF